MKNFLVVVALLLLTFSCQQNDQTNSNSESGIEEKINENGTREEVNETEPQFIENSRLAKQWYDELEKISREEERFTVEKEHHENRHVPKRTDTIIRLTKDETRMRIHTTKGLYAVESAEIGNKGFELGDTVKVGMARNQLEQILGRKLESDHIKVGNELQTNVFNFFFDQDIVCKIEFQGYVD